MKTKSPPAAKLRRRKTKNNGRHGSGDIWTHHKHKIASQNSPLDKPKQFDGNTNHRSCKQQDTTDIGCTLKATNVFTPTPTFSLSLSLSLSLTLNLISPFRPSLSSPSLPHPPSTRSNYTVSPYSSRENDEHWLRAEGEKGENENTQWFQNGRRKDRELRKKSETLVSIFPTFSFMCFFLI